MSKLLPLHLVHIQAAGYSPRTIYSRQRLLLAVDSALAPYGIDTPTTEELAGFLAHEGWSAWTRATYFRHITGFYNWACAGDRPHLDYNPAASLTPPKNPDDDPNPCTDAQLHAAIAASSAKWQLAIVLAAYAGLRASEIGRIRREHINAEHLTVWQGKGAKTKRLPTHPEIWRRVGPLPPGLLVPNPRGREMDVSNAARSHFDALGMHDIHMHRFRHWYATMLLRQGVDIRTLQKLMRHASITTTARYLEIVDEQRRLAISTLPVTTTPLQDVA